MAVATTDLLDTSRSDTLESAARRLAALLNSAGAEVVDPSGSIVDLEPQITPQLLEVLDPPAEVWAVDGGQAVVADARCVQVVLTRASRVCFRGGETAVEEEGDLRAHVVGGAEGRGALEPLGVRLASRAPMDAGLLREAWEWEALRRSVHEARPGALVLVDGDLLPDPRIPEDHLPGLLAEASRRHVVLAGVTKRSALSKGGAPLIVQLELEAQGMLGERATWWARVGRAGSLQVVVARLDRAAPFAFRVDIPEGRDPASVLGMLASVADDAAFPGYPYPLSVADRLAACPSWLRAESRLALDDLLARQGVTYETRERAFADRHELMERA